MFLPSVCNSSAPTEDENIDEENSTNNNEKIFKAIFDREYGADFDDFNAIVRPSIISMFWSTLSQLTESHYYSHNHGYRCHW